MPLRSLSRALGALDGVSVAVPLTLGLCLRVLWIVMCPNEPISDQTIYHIHAVDLAQGKGYVDAMGQPTAYWPVGYSAFLAMFYAVLGPVPSSGFVANLCLAGLTLWGIWELGKAWFERRVAMLGLWWLALHPTLIIFTTCLASENAFIPGTIWFAVLASRAAGASGGSVFAWVAATGVVAALTGYVRPTIALLSPLALVVGFGAGLRWPAVAWRTLLIGLFAAAALLPWTLRNHEHFGEYQPFSFNGKSNLWMGNHPGADGGYVPAPKEVEALVLPERERVLGERAKQFIFEDPLRYLGLCVRRTVDTLKTDTVAVVWNRAGIEAHLGARAETPLKALTTAHHWFVLLVAAWGVGRGVASSLRHKRLQLAPGELFSLTAVVLLALPFVLIVSGNRYHLPLIPFVVLLAAQAVWRLAEENQDQTAEQSAKRPAQRTVEQP